MEPVSGMHLVGWREYAALPELGVQRLPAKIDTGARTSSLHAANIELFDRDEESWVRFELEFDGRTLLCEAPKVARRSITSSNGQTQRRLIIKTVLRLGNEQFRAEFSLADRSDMTFPLLIGRTSLRHRFLVDSGRSYLVSDSPETGRMKGLFT
ncbi:ATP-dependent zinc protease [Altericroceibacterium endophyticum]